MSTTKPRYIDLYLNILIFFLISFIFFFIFYKKEISLSWDGYIYMALAENIHSGIGFTLCNQPHLFHSPGFPFLINVFMSVFKNAIISSQFICSFSYFITLSLIYIFCSINFKNKYIGIISIIIYFFSGNIQQFTNTILAENILTPFYSLKQIK